MTKRILAVLLALAMIFSLCSVNVFADDEALEVVWTTGTISNETARGWATAVPSDKIPEGFIDALGRDNSKLVIHTDLAGDDYGEWGWSGALVVQATEGSWSQTDQLRNQLNIERLENGTDISIDGAVLLEAIKAKVENYETTKVQIILNTDANDGKSIAAESYICTGADVLASPKADEPPAEDDTYVDFEHTTEVRNGISTHVTPASELKTSGIKVEFDGPAATDGEVTVVYQSEAPKEYELEFESKLPEVDGWRTLYERDFNDGKPDTAWEETDLSNDAAFIEALKAKGAKLYIWNDTADVTAGFQYGFQDTKNWNGNVLIKYDHHGDFVVSDEGATVAAEDVYLSDEDTLQGIRVDGAELIAACEAFGLDFTSWRWINGSNGNTVMIRVTQFFKGIVNVSGGQIFGYAKLPDNIPDGSRVYLTVSGYHTNPDMPFRAYLVDKYKNDNAKSTVLIAPYNNDGSVEIADYFAPTKEGELDTTGYIEFKTGWGPGTDNIGVISVRVTVEPPAYTETVKYKAGDTYVEIPTDISKAIQAIDIKPDTVKVSTVKMKSPQTKAEVPGITVDTPMQIGSGAVHGIIVNGKMLPMPHRFVNGICIGCGAKKTSGTITDMKTYLYQTYGNVAKPVYTVSKDAKYVLETTGGQDFEGKTVAGGLKLESADEIVRLATSWVGGGEVYNALIDALNANPDSVIKLTYTGTIKNFGVQSESAGTLYADFEVAHGEEYNTLTVSVADFLEATKAAIEDTGWRNVFVEPDGDVVLYGFEIVDA